MIRSLAVLLLALPLAAQEITDYHIHLRGGMTAAKALVRQQETGVRSTVLENHGREWPLNTSEKVVAFIAEAKASGLPVGLQVNDRDWYKQLPQDVLGRLDFILADTMILDGQRLWKPEVKIDDPAKWMDRYFAHNLQILDEPISILANPTYLPPCISNRYDELWTDARMKAIIRKAIEKNIALEIQAAPSVYPHERFILLARDMGATFSFGTNNFDDKPKDVSRWREVISKYKIGPDQLWRPPVHPNHHSTAARL